MTRQELRTALWRAKEKFAELEEAYVKTFGRPRGQEWLEPLSQEQRLAFSRLLDAAAGPLTLAAETMEKEYEEAAYQDFLAKRAAKAIVDKQG